MHDEALLARGIGIRFNAQERTTVEEYRVSEGWVRMAVGRALDRRGRPITLKFKGEVEPYFVDTTPLKSDSVDTDTNRKT